MISCRSVTNHNHKTDTVADIWSIYLTQVSYGLGQVVNPWYIKCSCSHDYGVLWENCNKNMKPPSRSGSLSSFCHIGDPVLNMFEAAEECIPSLAMSPRLAQPAGFTTSVKLPVFWQSNLALWYQHVQAHFHLWGVIEDDSTDIIRWSWLWTSAVN